MPSTNAGNKAFQSCSKRYCHGWWKNLNIITLLCLTCTTMKALTLPLSRYSTRSCRSRTALHASRRSSSSSPPSSDTLQWEKFEFGKSPKWDDRFKSSQTIVASNNEELEELLEKDAKKDAETAKSNSKSIAAWKSVSPDIVQRATDIVSTLVRPERIERIHSILQKRTVRTRFVFENPTNPSNVWACLRTMDSFGIQHAGMIVDSTMYKGKAALTQKRGMRTAMGAAQWMTLQQYSSTSEAVSALREELPGCVILASDVNPGSTDIRDIQWNEYTTATSGNSDGVHVRPLCFVMGNEERGISDEMRELCDGTFYLPMSGFAESFNLSVATAITLAYLNAASSNGNKSSPLLPGDLSESEYNSLVLKGLLNSVAQKRVAYALLRREGVELPDDMHCK